MDKEKIKTRIDNLVNFAKAQYAEGRDWNPMLEVVGVDDKSKNVSGVYLFGDTKSVDKRFEIIYKIGQGTANSPIYPLAVVFASEAWVSVYKDGQQPKDVPMPRNDPNKKEHFCVQALTSDSTAYLLSFEIKRQGDKVELIGDLDMTREGKTSAPFLEEFWKGYHNKLKSA